jgi:uncharacterized membrane protein YeaQ/YmgE (transglycosylase-associated protein family)
VDILLVILIGLIAGALAERVVSGHGYGVIGDIAVGVVGALGVGWVFVVVLVSSRGGSLGAWSRPLSGRSSCSGSFGSWPRPASNLPDTTTRGPPSSRGGSVARLRSRSATRTGRLAAGRPSLRSGLPGSVSRPAWPRRTGG